MIEIEKENFTIYTTTTKEGNMALHTSYDQTITYDNRIFFFNTINKNQENFAFSNQTHSTNLIEIKDEDRAQGVAQLSKYDNVDALYTKVIDLFVGVFHADCTPVLLYSNKPKLVCAIHAGFVGTVNGIIEKTIEHLIEKEGIIPNELKVYIMPSISQKNYQISKQMAEKVEFDNALINIDNEIYCSNTKIIIEQLKRINVLESNITIDHSCTFDDERFYSYRKNKTNKRNVSMIALK